MVRNTQARIDLSAISHNIETLRRKLGRTPRLLAVVKADAYGHGMVTVSRYLEERGLATMLGVAIVEEGMALRVAGIRLPILVLGPVDEEHMLAGIENDLTMTVFTVQSVRTAQRCAEKLGHTAHLHLKLDTGMNRIGVKEEGELFEILAALKQSPRVRLSGLFTHFAKSEEDAGFTALQLERFKRLVEAVRGEGFSPLLHAANSGGILNFKEARLDMVRAGIAMYGYNPDSAKTPTSGLIAPLSWHSRVVHLKKIDTGEGVSYGLRFTAQRETLVATLPVGYGDGYKRSLSGKCSVLIRGKRAPQIGTICMDQMMVDVTDIPGAAVGDEVVLIGRQGTEHISADELAALAGTISYEILLSISPRTPRVYVGMEN